LDELEAEKLQALTFFEQKILSYTKVKVKFSTTLTLIHSLSSAVPVSYRKQRYKSEVKGYEKMFSFL
jgi:hypothetical protein